MTMHTRYDLLAGLFEFPGPDYVAQGQKLLTMLHEDYPDAATELRRFLNGIPQDILALQELHTRTFDVQSVTTLDVGYTLFGDDYKRAALLSHLSYEYRQARTDCKGELADHLPNLLRLIPNLRNLELRAELVSEILIPALLFMLQEFEPSRTQKRNANYQKHYKTLIETVPGSDATIYRLALKALLSVLATDFQMAEVVAQLSTRSDRKPSVDFLGLIEKEMEIEEGANPTNSGCDA